MEYRKLIVALAVLGLGAVACSSDAPSTTEPTDTETVEPTEDTEDHGSGDEHVVEVIDSAFEPTALEVPVGATVIWDWADTTLPHNVVADDGTFDSGEATADPDTEYMFTFEEAGEYSYLCEIHGTAMAGTITVA